MCSLTCAGVALCFVAIWPIMGSSSTVGSPSFLKSPERPGDPRGAYASTAIPTVHAVKEHLSTFESRRI